VFIKWRTYQRQKYGKKGEKYYMQPVLVKSVRLSKKLFKEFTKQQGWDDNATKERWEISKAHMNRPRHSQVFRFPSFPSCAYVYYDDPNYIEYRKHYWEQMEIYLDTVLSELADKDKQKIIDEIETILPKPYGYLLEILERAYQDGMPKDPSPKEYYESQKV